MNGFSQGYQGVEEAARQSEQRRTNFAPYRLRLKTGEERHVSFIDDTAVSFLEHTYELNGSFYNYEHCIGPENGCPFCLGKEKVYRVTVYTVIDHSPWTDKKGQTYTDQKKILAAREDQAILLRDLSQLVGGLKGKRIIVRRGMNMKTSPAWGSSYTPAMQNGAPVLTDWSRFAKEVLVPYEYTKIFARKSQPELAAIYQQVQMGGRGRGVPTQQYGGQSYGQPPQQFYGQPQQYQQGFQSPPQQAQQWTPPPQAQGVTLPQSPASSPATNPADEFGADLPF